MLHFVPQRCRELGRQEVLPYLLKVVPGGPLDCGLCMGESSVQRVRLVEHSKRCTVERLLKPRKDRLVGGVVEMLLSGYMLKLEGKCLQRGHCLRQRNVVLG
jgi:hypothetical protein